MNNNILLNIYNITNFNKFIEVLNNLQCESTEIIIELFKEYLNQYNIIVFNDIIISNLQKILNYLFTYSFIFTLLRYSGYIDYINNIIKDTNINKNEKQLLNKIINNKFRKEDLDIFINYNFSYNSIHINSLHNFFLNLIKLFNYDQINYIIDNLIKIKDKYQNNIILLYNKLIINFHLYYKNINPKKYFDNLINILSSDDNVKLNLFLFYDTIDYIMKNIYNN